MTEFDTKPFKNMDEDDFRDCFERYSWITYKGQGYYFDIDGIGYHGQCTGDRVVPKSEQSKYDRHYDTFDEIVNNYTFHDGKTIMEVYQYSKS